jgi:phospholipid/cholesterol/gamma-HCH transport system substrate-binding protein
MEFNARFALTGAFALAVAAAIAGFVYWLNNTGGFGEQVKYQVRFTVPVSGLAPGSGVLFNGIRVGEVERIRFDPENPGSLLAVIGVSEEVPVRQDTLVGIDYQGLTGAANVMLTGGANGSPRIESGNGALPELEADPAASRSWTQNAGRVLGRLDDLLGRNSGRFDAILSGLERLAGGSKESQALVYELPAPQFSEPARERTWQLAIAEPSVMLSLNTDKLLLEPQQGVIAPTEEARWADNLPNLFQTQVVRSFENAGYTDGVLRPGDAVDPDYRLIIDIRSFQLSTAAIAEAKIDIVAKLVDRDGQVLGSRQFASSAPAGDGSPADGAKALGKLFSETMTQLVDWTVSSI